jgi:glycosyltransferase involved in cell wall biosynthesis
MKIVIDGRMIGWTGIGRYSIELLNQLEQLDHQNQYVVLMQSADWERWSPSNANFSRVRADIRPYGIKEQVALPILLRRLKPDLVHFLSFNSPILYVGKRVTTVHDLTLINFSVARGGWKQKLRYAIKRLVATSLLRIVTRQSHTVVTDTDYVRQQLIKGGYINPQRAQAIHLGTNLATKANTSNATTTIPDPYMMYVGNYYPNKNIPRLITALSHILPANPALKLVLVGNTEEYDHELKAHIAKLKLGDAVILAGRVNDDELIQLFTHAKLYTFPSLSEGFGIPGLEAMQHGVPVASSNATCLPEVYGDAAVYYDPLDTQDMAGVISETLADEKLRAKLKRAGYQRVKQFSWERMAQQTLEVYRNALKN